MNEPLTIPFDLAAMAAALEAFLQQHSMDVGSAACQQAVQEIIAAGVPGNVSIEVKLVSA